MPDLTRKELIAAGAAGAALAAAGRVALAEELGSKNGAPTLPHDPAPAKFDLAGLKPQVDTDWGTVRECTAKSFPILNGSDAAAFLTMKPEALRERRDADGHVHGDAGPRELRARRCRQALHDTLHREVSAA